MEQQALRFRFAESGGGPSGCYLLFAEGEVVYVGQSANVFARVAVHWQQALRRRKGKRVDGRAIGEEKIVDFDTVEIVPCPVHRLLKEERFLIQHHKPKHNVVGKWETVVPGFEKSKIFQDLLKKNLTLRVRPIK